jgi:hypothetical protein
LRIQDRGDRMRCRLGSRKRGRGLDRKRLQSFGGVGRGMGARARTQAGDERTHECTHDRTHARTCTFRLCSFSCARDSLLRLLAAAQDSPSLSEPKMAEVAYSLPPPLPIRRPRSQRFTARARFSCGCSAPACRRSISGRGRWRSGASADADPHRAGTGPALWCSELSQHRCTMVQRTVAVLWCSVLYCDSTILTSLSTVMTSLSTVMTSLSTVMTSLSTVMSLYTVMAYIAVLRLHCAIAILRPTLYKHCRHGVGAEECRDCTGPASAGAGGV